MRGPVAMLMVVLGSAGCQAFSGETLTEELPTAPIAPSGNPQTGLVVSPVQLPSPTNPQPTPTAPTPSATPSPAPTPDTGAPAFHHLRLGFFGVDCRANGKAEPNNGAKQVPAGCVGYLTATPKDAANKDVPMSIHGPDIRWQLMYGDGAVEVRTSIYPNDFNRDIHGIRPGGFQICAIVRNVEGCLTGEVTR